MKTGTKVYLQNSLKPRPRYQQILQKYYDTSVENVDFGQSKDIVQVVNNWAANITDGNIQNLVQEDDIQNSILLLLNAVYFKGAWRRPFKSEKTIKDTFQTKGGAVQTDFMTDTDNYYFFESGQLNAKILRIPYANSKFSMFVVLPKGTIEELIQKLEGKTVNREAWYLDEVEVRVKLPRFQFSTDSDLKAHLESVRNFIFLTAVT